MGVFAALVRAVDACGSCTIASCSFEGEIDLLIDMVQSVVKRSDLSHRFR